MPSFPTTPIAHLKSSSAPIHAITFSSGSGQYLLAGSADRSIRLYNPTSTASNGTASGRLIQIYNAHGYEVLDLAVSGDNSQFVSCGGDKTVFLWDVATGQTVRRFNGHAGRVQGVSFGGEGDSVVVSGSFDGTVKVWDLKARGEKPIQTFSEARDGVSSVAVLGAEIFAGSTDGRGRCYDLGSGFVETDVLPAAVTSVCPARDGQSYLVSTLDSTVRLMDRVTGKCLQMFKGNGFKNEEYRVRSMLAAGDGVVVSGSEDGRCFVWDVLTGDVVKTVRHVQDGEGVGKKRVVSAVAWNQVRKQWASAGGDGSVVVWGQTYGYHLALGRSWVITTWNNKDGFATTILANLNLRHHPAIKNRKVISPSRGLNPIILASYDEQASTVMPILVPPEYRYALIQLAKDGSTDAIDFLRQAPDFRETGRRGLVCYRILKKNGNARAGKIYDDQLRKERERAQRKRERRRAEIEFVSGNHSLSPLDDEMEILATDEENEAPDTQEAAETAIDSPSEDDMEDVEDEESRQEDLVRIKKERPDIDSSTRKDSENSQSTNSSNSDDPEDTNVERDKRQEELDHSNSTNAGPAVELVEVIVLSDNESDTTSELIANEYTLRKSRAEAGSLRESKILEKISLESEMHTLPAESESDVVQLKERNHLRLKLALVDADVAFAERVADLMGLRLSRCRTLQHERNGESAATAPAAAKVRKAWWDAEAAFSDLVLAFPQEKRMERPAFPSG